MGMHAAVVRSFDRPPRYETFDLPPAPGSDEVVVDVLAAGLHPRVRTDATGGHYTSTGELPMVPGIDGIGRLPDGGKVYFVLGDGTWGSMADQTVVDRRRTVPLPDGVDVVRMAATMNPAMSSWVALRRRVPLRPGQSVLVLGATGNAGTMAVQVAKRLGAGWVVGAGRDPDRLADLRELGADAVVPLDRLGSVATGASVEGLAAAAAEVDVVIDYVWGQPAAEAMMALLRARQDRSRALDWIQIGSVAGPTIELPSVALRSANLRIQGNGQGAVSPEGYVAELPSLIREIEAGSFTIGAQPRPLADVELAWDSPTESRERTVFIP